MPIWPVTEQELKCYPQVPEHVSMPWDGADELLVRYRSIIQQQVEQQAPEQPAVIIGDRYGALSCYFSNAAVVVDQHSAATAIKKNRHTNNLSTSNIHHDLNTVLDCVISTQIQHATSHRIEKQTITVIAKIPKQFEQLIQIYQRLAELTEQNYQVHLLLSGLARHTSVKWLNWLQQKANYYWQSKVIKKARLIYIQPRPISDLNALDGYEFNQLKLQALPGVFGRSAVDIGARALLPHLPKQQTGNFADLGCGNGILALTLKRNNPKARINAFDDSFVAIESVKLNAEINQLEIQTHHTNVFEGVQEKFDLIVCNPPFHDGFKQLDNIARSMFLQSSERLTTSGTLLIIANSHLEYMKYLRKYFMVHKLPSDNRKFVIYRCQLKRKTQSA